GYDIAVQDNKYFVSGIFSDSISLSNDQTGYDQCFLGLIQYGSLGLEFLSKSKILNLFPNPSTGTFNLQFEKSRSGTICIYDLLGNCILTQQLSNSLNQQISISEKARGIYFVEVQAGEKRYNQKIIVN
nr:T9SS type A sorting domain-containing protein [Bacteroidota bacterium]